jgi:hypothetical protein
MTGSDTVARGADSEWVAKKIARQHATFSTAGFSQFWITPAVSTLKQIALQDLWSTSEVINPVRPSQELSLPAPKSWPLEPTAANSLVLCPVICVATRTGLFQNWSR